MEKPHINTGTTFSATNAFVNNLLWKVMIEPTTMNTHNPFGPSDIYVECEVHDVPPCEECQEFDCFGCEYKGLKERHEQGQG